MGTSRRSATASSCEHPSGIVGPRHFSPKDLGKMYLTHSDKCVQGAQYKLLGTMGLNLGHVASKLGHMPVAVTKEIACALEAEVVQAVSDVAVEGGTVP